MKTKEKELGIMEMLESIGAVYIYTQDNLIEEKSQAFFYALFVIFVGDRLNSTFHFCIFRRF